MERVDSEIRTTRRMIQENLDSIEPIRNIIEKYQDKIYYVDFSVCGSSIGVKESNLCVVPDIEQEVCRLGYKYERTKHLSYSDKDPESSYHIRITPMRYLNCGELE